MIARWYLTAAILVLMCSTVAEGQSMYPSSARSSGSLYQDWKPNRAHRVGDILTVLITETTSATNTSNTETSKSNALDLSNGEGTGALQKFIPGFGLVSDASADYTGQGSTSRNQQITARVSVTVVGTKPNGDLIVEGSRTIEINGEREVVHLSGAVNPMIIPASNTIESYRVSDLQVTYKGKGVVSEGSRPGVLVRIINWIF
jgi:flagellar L-ring protein FlgH